MTDLPDERTMPSRRGHDDPVDDETALSGRRSTDLPSPPIRRAASPTRTPLTPAAEQLAADDEVLDEATMLSGRKAAGQPGPVSRPPAAAPASRPPAGPRRTGGEPVVPVDPDDGSTIVVRRRSDPPAAPRTAPEPVSEVDDETAVAGRSRDLAATTASDVPASLGRIAQAPEPTGDTYAARRTPPVEATRHTPPARDPQRRIDDGAVAAAARRRRRASLAVFVVAGVLVLGAVIALILVIAAN